MGVEVTKVKEISRNNTIFLLRRINSKSTRKKQKKNPILATHPHVTAMKRQARTWRNIPCEVVVVEVNVDKVDILEYLLRHLAIEGVHSEINLSQLREVPKLQGNGPREQIIEEVQEG